MTVNPVTAKANEIVSVTVEYGPAESRRYKQFCGKSVVGASRRFYSDRLRLGDNPRVITAARHGEQRPGTP